MLSISSLIEFLMNLLRDEAAQEEFERDPHGMLARHGLDGLCGQDVRDVAPILADHTAVSAKSAAYYAPSGHASGDPVHEITYLKDHYHVKNDVVINDNDTYNYHYSYVEDNSVNIAVDDRDTTTIHAEGDLTITDSFNQDNDVTVIQDSFNEDNDGVDNKGGVINESGVAGDDIQDSYNQDNDTTTTEVQDSFNQDNDTTQASADSSFNQDNDDVNVEADSVGEDVLVTT